MKITRPNNLYTLTLFLFLIFSPISVKAAPLNDGSTPVDFKVAFFGDLSANSQSVKLLEMVRDEGTDMVIHLGDLDYEGDPAGFERRVKEIFGEGFVYLQVIGNHDKRRWYGEGGYKEFYERRLKKAGLQWHGEAGVLSTIKHKGIFIVTADPGISNWNFFTDPQADFIRTSLAKDTSTWRICIWHKNQNRMQTAGKGNSTGWSVYDECLKGGAFIATAHSHTYSRSFLMDNFSTQNVVNRSNELRLSRGRSFVVVSGLGGGGSNTTLGARIDSQRRVPTDQWWASVYTADQGATLGALFCEFNKGGIQDLAYCYFKNIRGQIIDDFFIRSSL